MDLDFLSDVFNDNQPALTGSLLSNLPYSTLASSGDYSYGHSNPHSNRIGFNEIDEVIPRISNTNEPGAVISKIEDIFEAIADCILEDKKGLTIQLKTRKRTLTQVRNTTNCKDSTSESTELIRKIRFPSKKPQEAWKFAAIVRILELSHEALATGIVTTKRDIYYRDPELFMKQAVVDRYVDDIAYTLGVKRDALNVVAAAKGLISGSFTILRTNGSLVDYGSETEGILIPNIKEIKSIKLLDARWILVIEKEATFRTLSTTQYWAHSTAGKGIILTAKGYPDISTRRFLHYLSQHIQHQQSKVPIYALVDFDPDGIGIMSTYKHSSANLAHEGNGLAVPSIRWLGVCSGDMMRRNRDNDEIGDASSTEIEIGNSDKVGLLTLTKRDRRIAIKMFGRDLLEDEREWRRELQVMLMLNLKAEIQVLSSGVGGLEAWLDRKLMGQA